MSPAAADSVDDMEAKAQREAKNEWAAFYRKITHSSVPSVVSERWLACGNDNVQKRLVEADFLACGGDMGKFAAFENAKRVSSSEATAMSK